jgi:hypothetical protein
MQYTVRAFVEGRDERLLEGPSMASGKGLMATTLDAQSGSSIRLIHTRRLWCSCGAGRISYTSQPYRTAWLGSAIGRDARRRILLIDSVGRKGPTPRGGVEPQSKATGVRAAEGFEPSCHTKHEEPSIFMHHPTWCRLSCGVRVQEYYDAQVLPDHKSRDVCCLGSSSCWRNEHVVGKTGFP